MDDKLYDALRDTVTIIKPGDKVVVRITGRSAAPELGRLNVKCQEFFGAGNFLVVNSDELDLFILRTEPAP